MSNTLVDQYIEDTFPGLLHSSGEELPESGKANIYDGNGNKSAISVGRENNGVGVTGELTVTGNLKNKFTTYPTTDPTPNDLIVADKANPTNLKFLSLKDLLTLLGGLVDDGTYENPTIVFENGILTQITSNPLDETVEERGIISFTDPGRHTFTVPSGVRSLKFYVTGGGGTGGKVCGGSGATAIGYLRVTPGQVLSLTIGSGGGSARNTAGLESKLTYNGADIVIAGGGSGAYNYYGTATTNDVFGIIMGTVLINGGEGKIDTDEGGDEESIGAASYWGSSPAYGGGGGSHGNYPQGSYGANGVVVFEW